MSGTYYNQIADGDTVAGYDPFDLFAGESPVITDRATVASGQDLAQFEVVAFNTSGELVAYDDTADYIADADTVAGGGVSLPLYASKPIGIMCQAVDASGGAAEGTFYRAGFFNHAALVWPAGVSTLALRRAAFAGTPIGIGAVQRDT